MAGSPLSIFLDSSGRLCESVVVKGAVAAGGFDAAGCVIGAMPALEASGVEEAVGLAGFVGAAFSEDFADGELVAGADADVGGFPEEAASDGAVGDFTAGAGAEPAGG